MKLQKGRATRQMGDMKKRLIYPKEKITLKPYYAYKENGTWPTRTISRSRLRPAVKSRDDRVREGGYARPP